MGGLPRELSRAYRTSGRNAGTILCQPASNIEYPRGPAGKPMPDLFQRVQCRKSRGTRRIAFVASCVVLSLGVVLAGCRKNGLQGPLAPGLHGPVTDLMAIRAANEISLGWTIPKKRLGKFQQNGFVQVRICRRENLSAPCIAAGAVLRLAPGTVGSFTEKLPDALAAGTPRIVYYSVEVLDRSGHATGLMNSVPTLAGAPPPPVQGLTAELSGDGVELHWNPFDTPDTQQDANGAAQTKVIVRLHRFEILARGAAAAGREGTALPMAATAGIDLDVEDGARTGQALDKQIEAGKTYRYLAQQVVQIRVGDRMLEMAGQYSQAAVIGTAGGAGR